MRECITRGGPFGTEAWQTQTVREPGLESSLNPRGRPRKAAEEAK